MKLNVPDWMTIDAVRYATGRRSYQVAVTVDWLARNWSKLSKLVRNQIQTDLEESFTYEDAAMRLGDSCDRTQWERVRQLWK